VGTVDIIQGPSSHPRYQWWKLYQGPKAGGVDKGSGISINDDRLFQTNGVFIGRSSGRGFRSRAGFSTPVTRMREFLREGVGGTVIFQYGYNRPSTLFQSVCRYGCREQKRLSTSSPSLGGGTESSSSSLSVPPKAGIYAEERTFFPFNVAESHHKPHPNTVDSPNSIPSRAHGPNHK